MKELSVEEKAKLYDEAIKIAKSKIKNDKDHILYEDDIIEIFSELKENKDEKIKQKVIKLIKMSNEVGGFALHKWEADEMLAWVENSTWKPSDEQMKRLEGAINSLPHQEVLYSLYQDLKKLRE